MISLPERPTGPNGNCGGVLIPDGTRHCFVQERGVHPTGRPFTERELSLSVDHVIPRSMGGADGPTHLAHRYCQDVQGGMIGGPIGGPIGGRAATPKLVAWNKSPEAAEVRSRNGRATGARNLTHDGRYLTHEGRVKGALIGALIGNCSRWNIARGKPCVCGRHT